MKTWLIAFLAGVVSWYAVVDTPGAPSSAPARIDIAWTSSNGLGTYHLRGRFVIRGLNDGSSTSVSNESQPNITHSEIEVRPGVYSLTLEDGFQLARVPAPPIGNALEGEPDESEQPGDREDDESEVGQAVTSNVLSSNPLIVVAQPGRVALASLSLVTLRQAQDDDTPCVN